MATSNERLHRDHCKNTVDDVNKMEKLLSEHPQLLEKKFANLFGMTVTSLFDAAFFGHHRCLQFLLNAGANVHAKSGEDDAMTHAILNDSENIAKLLLDFGFSPDYVPEEGENEPATMYLQETIVNGKSCKPIFDLLIQHGASVNDFNNLDKISPCVYALMTKNDTCLKIMLLHNAAVDHRQVGRSDLSPKQKDKLSLIHKFAKLQHPDISNTILNILYQLGANLWQKNRHGLTPLQVREHLEAGGEEQVALGKDVDPDFYVFKTRTLEYKELMGKPLSLSSLSRIALLRSMGSQYLSKIELLDLPPTVLSFLQGSDLPDHGYQNTSHSLGEEDVEEYPSSGSDEEEGESEDSS